MPELVADCPRCGAKEHTFIAKTFLHCCVEYRWRNVLESYCICKNCSEGTIFKLGQKDSTTNHIVPYSDKLHAYKDSLNQLFEVDGFINTRNMAIRKPPKHIPEDIERIFKEGSESLTGNCPNAAGAMFRLCIDLVTKKLLPDDSVPVEGLNRDVKKKLFNRLEWLFKRNILPDDLKELSDCIREDGNDGAHDGSLTSEDSEDLFEFTYILLERIYTQPAQVESAAKRRQERRNKIKGAA